MTADELRAALEADMAWRQEDLAFFKNQLNNISEDDKDRYRKSLVLILYSHMEGFVMDIAETAKAGYRIGGSEALLFDYKERDPLTYAAKIVKVSIKS